MNNSKFYVRSAGLVVSTTLAAFVATSVFTGNAFAACAILSKDAQGSSIERAGHKAKRKALREVRKTAGEKAAQNASLSEPACFFLDDGTNTVNCSVEASYCTDPVASAPEPVDNPGHKFIKYNTKWKHSKWHKRRYVAGGWHRSTRQEVCLHYKARASGVTKHEAVHTAFGAISDTARAQIHVGLKNPGFEVHEPSCNYRAGSSYPYVCHTAASYCPSSSW